MDEFEKAAEIIESVRKGLLSNPDWLAAGRADRIKEIVNFRNEVN